MMRNNGFQVADRMANIQIHFFAKVLQKINNMEKNGVDVIRLDEGSPDMPPNQNIIDSLTRSASNPTKHSYQPHRGNPELRKAWANMLKRLYNIDLDPEREVIPLIGSKEGIVHFPLTYLNHGDVVLIPDPGYISYTRGTQLAGGIPYYFPLKSKSNFLPDLKMIPKEVIRKAKIIWLNYPNNPTAVNAPLEFFQEAVNFGIDNHLLICHDSAYNQITYNGIPAPSIFQANGAKEVAVEFHSLSKSHNMAGWRIGAIIGDSEIIQPFYSLKTNIDSGHFLPILDSAVEAMNGDQEWLKERNEIYRQRRDIVINTLYEMNLNPEIPQGSLYVWSPIPKNYSSIDYCSMILDRAYVSLTPGVVFGENGEGYLRISLTAKNEQIIEAMKRIKSIKL